MKKLLTLAFSLVSLAAGVGHAGMPDVCAVNAAALGARLDGPTGKTFTLVVVNPAKVQSFGFRGVKVNDRLRVTSLGNDRFSVVHQGITKTFEAARGIIRLH